MQLFSRKNAQRTLTRSLSASRPSRQSSTFSVAWIDALASRHQLGRAILETAEFSAEDNARQQPSETQFTGRFPRIYTQSRFNRNFQRVLFPEDSPAGGRERRVSIRKFLYPLDNIENWNCMYGKRGFFQFQCVLPDEYSARGLRQLLTSISQRRAASFLAVLKTLGGEGIGMLSFPMRGYTLTLDFPNRVGVRELLSDLEKITLNYGGRVYLARISTLSASAFRDMYPRLRHYRRVLEAIDPECRMMSDMARRLLIRSPKTQAAIRYSRNPEIAPQWGPP